MPGPLASLVVGAVLLAAATAKLADRPGTVVALATYGIAGRAAHAGWGVLVAVEAALGALLLAGSLAGAVAATALLGAFGVAQASALASGLAGAPCGCLGARGRLGGWSVGRTAALAALAGAAVVLAPSPVAWPVAAAIAAAAVLAGLRVRPPRGALDVDGEGPELGARSALAAMAPGGLRLVVFTSEGCHLCRRLAPALERIREERAVTLHVLDEERDAAAWLAARVPGSPYAVVLDAHGVVLAKGTVNTGRQLRSLLPAQGSEQSADQGSEQSADSHNVGRRGFLRRGARVAAGVYGAATVGRLIKPGEAEAYHFCGHIYTTDSCPHPTGLPRIDARGFPLRAGDGRPVDDLGRLIDDAGRPVDEDGVVMADADGRPLPVATRTRVCTATGRQYRIPVRVDGAWYRCCGGTVRKLVDCCTPTHNRINGDRALKGYCYRNRKVFCVMYFQTRVPC